MLSLAKTRSVLSIAFAVILAALACTMLCVERSYAAANMATWVTQENSAGQITSVKLDMSSMTGYTSYHVILYKDGKQIYQTNASTAVFDVTDTVLSSDSGVFSAEGMAYKSGAYTDFATSADLKFYTITIDRQGHGDPFKINHVKDQAGVKTAVRNAYISTFDAGDDGMLMRYFENGDAFMGVALHPLSNYGDIMSLKGEAVYMLPGGSGNNYTLGGNVTLYDIWFKVINNVDLTVEAPICGDSTSIGKSGSEWDWDSQTNTPNVSIPAGAGYHYASSDSWWIDSVANDSEPFAGTFVGGNSYAFQSCVYSDFGYVFPTDNDTSIDLTVTVNGQAIPRGDAYNDTMPYSFSVIDSGSVPLTIDATVAVEHVEAIDSAVEPSCTESGLSEGSHCSKCNAVLQAQSTVPALGHKWGDEFVTETEPTCTEPGVGHKVCTRCDTPGETEDIPALGHHSVADPVKPATLSADGKTGGSHCDRCGTTIAAPKSISHPKSFKLAATSYTYNGNQRKPAVTVKDAAGKAIASANYKVTYANNVKAGTASATIKFNGKNYTGTKKLTFKIKKAANALTIKAKTATLKYSNVKKKAQVLTVGKVIAFTKKGNGKMSYAKVSGNKGITINKTTGKVTVKKGLKKGTYKVKAKARAAGDANHNASAWKTVTFKVVVK